jgi:hypothetical protein
MLSITDARAGNLLVRDKKINNPLVENVQMTINQVTFDIYEWKSTMK